MSNYKYKDNLKGIFFSIATISKISMFLYLFFVFFGTTMPFQERITNVDEIATSNPINQFVFSILYLLAIIALIPLKDKVKRFIKREKLLSLFLIWSLITILWSDFPIVSLKRWIQIFGTFTIGLAFFLHTESSEELLKYIKWILIAYLPLTLLSVLLVPEATQWEFPAWRGLAHHKNLLGQIALVSIIVWFPTIKQKGIGNKLIGFFFLGFSIIIFIGARSKTCFLTAAIIFLFWALFNLSKFLGPPKLVKFYFFAICICVGGILLAIIFLEPDIIDPFFRFFGIDTTFTGRTDLWKAIFNEVQNHPIQGCGFGGYWVMSSTHLAPIFEEFVWLPNTAHMGYLDILNETGYIGLSLLIIMCISYFIDRNKQNTVPVWKWLIIAVLIFNTQESTLFRQNIPTGVLFIFAYMAKYSDILKANKKSSV